MKHVSLENLKAFAQTLERQIVHTRAQKKEFTVAMTQKGLEYTPASSGIPRINDYGTIQRVLERFNKDQSFRPCDYMDLTRNASYLLTILEMYFQQP